MATITKLMTKENEKEFKNSYGYFKDPYTGKPLTGKEERVGESLIPRVKDSQGNSIPIVSTLWTQAEKDRYNAERKNGASSGTGASTRVNSKKDNELREQLLGLHEFLSKVLKGEDLNKANAMIDKIMPADPELAKKEAKIAKLKAMLAELEG